MQKFLGSALATLAVLASVSIAHAQPKSGPRVEDLVRAGKVRVAVFPPQYTKNQSTGSVRGWTVYLGEVLATRLGGKVMPVEYPGPCEAMQGLKGDACD